MDTQTAMQKLMDTIPHMQTGDTWLILSRDAGEHCTLTNDTDLDTNGYTEQDVIVRYRHPGSRNLGTRVVVYFARNGSFKGGHQILNNVTEIHYGYDSVLGGKVAFESDIHGTGCTYDLTDIQAFRTTPAESITPQF